jgi:hypothetical protein
MKDNELGQEAARLTHDQAVWLAISHHTQQLDIINELDGELWFDTCVDQVKSEEFEVDDIPIRTSSPSCMESTCVSLAKFEVEPSIN